jgi:predicted DNA-binding transcriptional regulator AlpA
MHTEVPVHEPAALSVRAVAHRYSASVPTVWRWTRTGDLPRPVRIGGSTRWLVRELEAWERNRCALKTKAD